MKKLIALILAALMLLSLAACGKKEETPAGNENQTENTQQDNTTESGEKGDPAEYSMDYWSEKYPGENICPFYIEIGGVEYILRGYERFDEKLRKLGASVQRVPSRSYATV